MGCCLSTPKNDQNGLKNQHLHLRSHAPKSNATQEAKCRSPPLVVVEEESVKEVLLETPIFKPQVPILKPETETQIPIMQTRKDPIINKAFEEASEEVTLISEKFSVGENFSTTTTTTTTTVSETSKTKLRVSKAPERELGTGIEPTPMHQGTVLTPSREIDSEEECKGPNLRRGCEGSNQMSRSPSCVRTVGEGSGQSELRPPGGVGRRLPPLAKDESDEVVGGDKRSGSPLSWEP